MVLFKQDGLTFEDEDNVDQFRFELDTGDLKVTDLSSSQSVTFRDGGGLDTDSITAGSATVNGPLTLDGDDAHLNMDGQNLVGSIGGSPTWTGEHTFGGGLQTNDGFVIEDTTGAGTAVQYDTDTSAGVLRTPNAGIRVEDNGLVGSGNGLEFAYNSTRALIRNFDYSDSSYGKLDIRGDLIDFSGNAANLRLATGQAIEDGSGNDRIEFDSNRTSLLDENGDRKFDAKGNGEAQITVDGNQFYVYDLDMDARAFNYRPSSSTPGTLELTNANLDANNNAITNASSVETEEMDFVGDVYQSPQKTPSVGTSSTVIHDDFKNEVARITVYGFSDGNSFLDEVIAFSGSGSSIQQIVLATRSTPDGRSYSNTGTELSLAMDAGDYAVTAMPMSLNRA